MTVRGRVRNAAQIPCATKRGGRNISRVDRGDAAEEQAVARHRVIDPRAGEDEPVVATESGNHDRGRHGQRARLAKNGIHRGDRHAILRRVLDSVERQGRDVGEVREDVEDDDQPAAGQERARRGCGPDRALRCR